ncbi:MAG: DUF2127 domain-containing protein [Acidobacteriota bacterium]|nr:DUF2127 domain-containing protein [Acidobacteriota bacterium]
MSEQILAASIPGPPAVDLRSSKAGLRAVATLEAFKGALVILLGVTLLLVHSHVEDYTESLLYHLHIDFDRRFGHMLLNAATTVSDARWWTIGVAAASYASVRFVEAWGLWNQRVWAEWFALLSGALYLPLEFLKVMERPDWERVGVLVINLIIVLYMLYIRIRECRVGDVACKERAEERSTARRSN